MPTPHLHSRKPFHHHSSSSSSSSSNSSTPPLDEQSQSNLLTTLSTSNHTTDKTYIKLFTFLPLATIPSFLIYLFHPSSRGGVRLLCLLGVTSLLASAWGMWFIPSPYSPDRGATGIYGEDGYEDSSLAIHLSNRRTRNLPFTDIEIDEDGPLGRSLPYLNLGICVILVVAGLGLGFKSSERGYVPEGFWGVLFLPAVILGVVAVVKKSMRDVEVGIGELGRMRYGLKGA